MFTLNCDCSGVADWLEEHATIELAVASYLSNYSLEGPACTAWVSNAAGCVVALITTYEHDYSSTPRGRVVVVVGHDVTKYDIAWSDELSTYVATPV